MDIRELTSLLKDIKDGTIEIEQAVQRLRHLPFEDAGFAMLDHHRTLRCGFPEVIYCPGKTTPQITEIFRRLSRSGQNVMATRATPEIFNAVKHNSGLSELIYESAARIILLKQKEISAAPGRILIVTAGTADIPVAEEARITARMYGQNAELLCDIGVAGLHRLLNHLPLLQQADVIIVVAGMEGALASVVGGLVDCPVIAIPTSVGYGASFEGLSALLTMLNSCASGVTVVNIDNGFGAAVAAAAINRRIHTVPQEKKH